MGLWGKLRNREQDHSESHALANAPQDVLPNEMPEIEKAIVDSSSRLSKFRKIPLSEIAALGGVFAQLSPALRTAAQTVTLDGFGYMPINNLGGEALQQFAKDTPGIFAGSFKNISTGKSTMAKFVKIEPQTITSNTVMPINPMMMAMAVMMVQVNQKLDTIQKTQREILSFIQEDKKAKLQGDLNILTDILDKYKYNWNNEQYRYNYHMKALDIKEHAEQSIKLYQAQIDDKTKELPSLFFDRNVRDTMNRITDDFSNYNMALYLFAFSSYLEVMLLGNFSQDYLNAVAQKVRDYQAYYQERFEKSCDYIAKQSSGSIQMKVHDAVGQAGKFLGNLIGSTPLLKTGSVDEWLIDSSKNLQRGKEERVAKIVAEFESKQESIGDLFIDSIQSVRAICNETQAVMFDKDYLYLVD